MVVMKFGGTSVGSSEAIGRVVSIVEEYRSLNPVVVVSAMSKVTDSLRAIGQIASAGEMPTAQLETLRQRHEETVRALLVGTEKEATLSICSTLLDELENICRGVTLLKELSPRTIDLLSSFGERLSAPIVASLLRSRGIPSVSVDARTFIRTDERYTEADVDFPETDRLMEAGVSPIIAAGQVPVITGFVGSTVNGVTTTLGRGASDYTASIVGSALHAAEIWIWTDVDGAMTADPRIVEDAQVLTKISYEEAAEMSYFGAKVLHPKTMLPAVRQHIPIRVKNTFNPSHPGTLISDQTSSMPLGVKTVTSIDHLCLIMIQGSSLIGLPDTPARVFKTTADRKVVVLMITQASSEHDICLLIDENDGPVTLDALKAEFTRELERGGLEAITMQPKLAVVAVVGQGMKGTPGMAARTFGILGEHRINIIAIAQGSSELNISFVVAHEDLQRAVRFVHSAFELGRKNIP